MFGCDRQHEHVLKMLQAVPQVLPVSPTRRDELVKPLELGEPDRGLHIGDLQIIAEMRIGVFVIVAERQFAELPAEPLACRCCPCPARNSSPCPNHGSIPRFA